MPPNPPRIRIIGAGISGLVLGRCLLHRGIPSTIFEKAAPTPRRNNYAITLYPRSYKPLLPILGIDEATFRQRVAVDADGERVNRNRLESLLAEGLDVQWDTEVENVESVQGEGVVVVGADGPHSMIRQKIAPKADFEILPYAVYNGKRTIPREEFKGGETMLEHRIESSGALLRISVDDMGEQEVRINYTYSRPASNSPDQDPLYNPTRSKSAAKDIPEELYAEISAIYPSLPAPFNTIFDPETIRKDRKLNWLMRSIQVSKQDLQTAAQRGIVLLGEAVHAEPILASKGANEAIEDAMVLAECIEKGKLEDFYEIRWGKWKEGIEESERRMREIHGKLEKAAL